MNYDPSKHHRKSIRLKGYDYSQSGGYFATILTHNHECLFGDVSNGETVLNELGKMALFTWNDLPNHNQHIILDEFVIMPNHIHGIIFIAGAGSNIAGEGINNVGESINNVGAGINIVGAGSEPAPTLNKCHGLPEIIRQFKTFSSRRINKHRGTMGVPVWQRNYYDHIIRDENELIRIREYIINNPLQWEMDNENPDRLQ